MKRIFEAMMIIVLCNMGLSATNNYYQSVCKGIANIGRSIEKVDNIPAIGKLTNILPFAVLAASLKECPMQTMIIVGGLLAYVLSYNESVQAALREYNIMNCLRRSQNKEDLVSVNENLFVFDEEEDEEDDEMEDDLLDGDSSEDEARKNAKKEKRREKLAA